MVSHLTTVASQSRGSAVDSAADRASAVYEPHLAGIPEMEAAAKPPPATRSITWVDPNRGSGHGLRIGIEFDGRQLVVVGLRRKGPGGRITYLAATDFEPAPTSADLEATLRGFVDAARPHVDVVLSTPRAVTRQFLIPAVRRRRRRQAALWQAQKLVPFPLNGRDSVCGMSFTEAKGRGWWVSMAALPRDDGAPLLEAIAGLGWRLGSVSLVGAQRQRKATHPAAESRVLAVMFCSGRRSVFTIHQHGRLIFHYDLGPLSFPAGPGGTGILNDPTLWRGSITAMAGAIRDAFDFYLNLNPQAIPELLEVVGTPLAVAPLLSDWEGRFGMPVVVADPTTGYTEGLPEEVARWVQEHIGDVAPALLATTEGVTIDVTPEGVRAHRRERNYTRVARSAFVISLAAAAVWSGLLATRARDARRALRLEETDLAQLHDAPAGRALASTVATLERQQRDLQSIGQVPVAWMPWLKTVLATLPANAALRSLSVAEETHVPEGKETTVVLILEGTFSPDGAPHAVTYRNWVGRLETLTGKGRVRLLNERTTEWDGRTCWAFTVQMQSPVGRVSGWDL